MSNSALHRLSKLHSACGISSCSPFLLQVFLPTKQHFTQQLHHTYIHTHKKRKKSKELDPSFLFSRRSMIAACALLILWHSCRSLKLITYSFSFFPSLLCRPSESRRHFASLQPLTGSLTRGGGRGGASSRA